MLKKSLIARLSLLFFTVALINSVLFWVATGSNQMRLIAEKSTLHVQHELMVFRQHLNEFFKTNPTPFDTKFFQNQKTSKKFGTFIQEIQNKNKDLIESILISDNSGKLLFDVDLNNKEKSVTPEDLQSIIKSIRLRDAKNETFFSRSDVGRYQISVFLPLSNIGETTLVLKLVYSMQSMREEYYRLIRLGVFVIGILLIIQIALAFFLYRLLIAPLRKLEKAAIIVGQGEYAHIGGFEKRVDEVGVLVVTFNRMSADIRDQKAIIQKNYEELKHRDEVMKHELMIAERIQRTIFPKDTDEQKLALYYRPLYAVSGDYYDVFNYPDGSMGFLICDASGHGVPAALLTMMAKSAFANQVHQISDPGELMSVVNQQIADSLELSGQYLTAFYIRIYPDGNALYCNANHPSSLLVSADKAEASKLDSSGFYIGMMREVPFPFETRTTHLAPGQLLILYSDGITEAKNANDELFGESRLQTYAAEQFGKSPQEVCQKIRDRLSEFCPDDKLNDDVTLLVISTQK